MVGRLGFRGGKFGLTVLSFGGQLVSAVARG
jgi:hypothetical protein